MRIDREAITPGPVPGVHGAANSDAKFSTMTSHWVYIQASKPRGTLYIGRTEDLARRSREHAQGRGSAFTRKYGVGMLVWFQQFDSEAEARQREKTMKEWPRQWKVNLVERTNPEWQPLAPNRIKEEDA